MDTHLPVLAEVMLWGQGRGSWLLYRFLLRSSSVGGGGVGFGLPVLAEVQLFEGKGFGLPVLAEVQLCKGGQVSEGLLGHLATGQRTSGL